MKNILTLSIVFVLCQFFKGQKQDINLKELQITTAPSAILLGISPSELETPKSKKAFVFSLVNSFKKNEGIPNSYAFEITPFWLLPSSKMNALKYAGITYDSVTKDYKRNFFSEIRKASFSLGFAKDLDINSNDEIKNPAFAFSVRSTVIKIRSKKNKEDIVAQNKKVVKILDKIGSDFANSQEAKKERWRLVRACMATSENSDSCSEIATKKLNEFIKTNTSKYKDDNEDVNYYRNLIEAPPLLALDFAGGYSTFFTENKFSNNQFGKLGFWMTLNSGIDFTKKDNPNIVKKLNFYGIARYLEDGTTLDDNQQFLKTKNLDFGGKAEFVYNRFSISYEYIYRKNDLESTFRSNGLIAYKVSDQVYINAAFGKNYGNKDNLISFLGLNWGLDSERKSVFVDPK